MIAAVFVFMVAGRLRFLAFRVTFLLALRARVSNPLHLPFGISCQSRPCPRSRTQQPEKEDQAHVMQ